MKPRNRWWDRTLTVAVITAAAAILGAGVGAMATYYGDHHLQEEQSKAAARGVARVLTAQLAGAMARLDLALEKDQLILPDSASAVTLPTDDEQLLAANLDADAWTKVASALVGLQIEQEVNEPNTLNMPALEAEAGRTVPLDPRMRELNESVLEGLNDAIEAMAPLASG